MSTIPPNADGAPGPDPESEVVVPIVLDPDGTPASTTPVDETGARTASSGGDRDPDGLDGHTMDELADYLDAGMQPPDPTIDDSPACQNALAAIARVRAVSVAALDVAALDEAPADDSWVGRILANISLEARSGRDIPFRPTAPTEHGVITEGSVRALVRRAGDSVDGLLIGRCALEGDVTVLGEPIRVHIWASVLWGNPIPEAVDRLRTAVMHELLEHTELVVEGIDVEIRDVLLDRAAPQEGVAAAEPTDPTDPEVLR